MFRYDEIPGDAGDGLFGPAVGDLPQGSRPLVQRADDHLLVWMGSTCTPPSSLSSCCHIHPYYFSQNGREAWWQVNPLGLEEQGASSCLQHQHAGGTSNKIELKLLQKVGEGYQARRRRRQIVCSLRLVHHSGHRCSSPDSAWKQQDGLNQSPSPKSGRLLKRNMLHPISRRIHVQDTMCVPHREGIPISNRAHRLAPNCSRSERHSFKRPSPW